MYAIIDDKPYAIRDNKVYEVSFGDRGTIKIGEEAKNIKVEGQTYTYDEISRKFNLKAMLQRKNEPTKELVDELNKQINALIKENEALKEQLASYEDEPVEEVVKEEVEETTEPVEEVVEKVEEENKKNK